MRSKSDINQILIRSSGSVTDDFIFLPCRAAVGTDVDAQIRSAHPRHSGVGLRQPPLGSARQRQHGRFPRLQFHRSHRLRSTFPFHRTISSSSFVTQQLPFKDFSLITRCNIFGLKSSIIHGSLFNY